MQLAAAAGLSAAPVEIRSVEGLDFLMVERYDRRHRARADGAPVVDRLHQEDFCQALGIVSEQKYQREGGPSLKQCFALVRQVSSAPVIDLARLLDAVVFNYLVGNNDAHGKNFSLVYQSGGTDELETRFSPLYDLVSTVCYPDLSPEMAMRIGQEYSSDKVTLRDFDQLAAEAKLGKPLVRERLLQVIDRVMAAMASAPAQNQVAEKVSSLIRQRCEIALSRFHHGS
jgi:serine/threonine-protein kinase HipA